MKRRVFIALASIAISVSALSATPALARDGDPQPCSSYANFYNFLSEILIGRAGWTVLFSSSGKCHS